MRLARELASWVDAHPDFERLAPVPFSVVCFRWRPSALDVDEAGLDDLNQRDALGAAQLLAAAAKQESPDLILTGLQSDDLGYGQTGVIIAVTARYTTLDAVMASGNLFLK